MKLSKIFLSETTRPSAFIFNIYNIIKRSFTKIVQIMPLGFSIIGSTVNFSSGERPRALWALLLLINVIALCVSADVGMTKRWHRLAGQGLEFTRTFRTSGFFLAHLSTKCSVSFCDPSLSGVRRPRVRLCVRQQFL